MATRTSEDTLAHCDECDLTFYGLHVVWFDDYLIGEAECPECGEFLDVFPPSECWRIDDLEIVKE